jgi:hypothetical protein
MQRRQLDFHDFDAVAAEVERLRRYGYARAGNWDLRQVCEHLTATMRMSLEGFSFQGPPWPLRVLIAPLLRWRFFKTRRMPAGYKGPEPLMPNPAGDENAAVRTFNEMLARVRDPGASFHPSPFLGKLTAEQWRQLHLIHAAHHLGFLVPRDSQQGEKPAAPTIPSNNPA